MRYIVLAKHVLRLGLLVPFALGSAVPRTIEADQALITSLPTIPRDIVERDVIDSLTSKVDSFTARFSDYAQSLLSSLGSDIPSYVTEGILPGQIDLPTGSDVISTASVSSTDLDALPTQVLNIPGYGNWTSSGWNLRVHGNVYKQPDIAQSRIDDLADIFLIDTSVSELPPDQAEQARNLTREIFVVQQADENVTVNIFPGQSDGNSPPNAATNAFSYQLPYETTPEGDFDTFIPVQNVSNRLVAGNGTQLPQKLNIYANGTDTGNATSYLVSEEGLTIISDIDDILRVTKIYQPKEGLLNTFARPFTPWMNMPDIYSNWSQSLPDMHFHYLTTTPEQATRNYMQFIYNTYPGGSFDTRPLNFSDLSATLSIRKFLLDKIFQTFPRRKFILVADTSNSDVMRDYPEMAKQYPGQVQCIFLRNTSATDSGDRFPYNTEGFKDLNQQIYMFFLVPDDLSNLDIVNGQCYNSTIPQNLTFGYQNLPFGLTTGDGKNAGSKNRIVSWQQALFMTLVVAFVQFL